MATITISGKFGNNTDLARRVVTFVPLDSPFGSGDEVVFGPEFSVTLDASGDASLTMLEGNYLCWLKGYESATATIAVPSGSGTHNINSIFATSTASGLNSVSTGQLDWLNRSTAPSNPPSGYYKVYLKSGTLYTLNSIGTETAFAGDVAGPESSTDNNFASFDGTSGKVIQDSGLSASSFAGATHASNHTDGTDDIQNATSGQKGLMTSAYASKLDGIEAAADVTDEANVTDALNGATLSDIGTPVSGDKVLVRDASDSNILKEADFDEFGGGASDHGALSGLVDDDHSQYSLISSQAGAPSSTPGRVGEINVDTTGDVPYVSTDTAGSSDWRGLYTFDGTDVAVVDGGTGASTASGARTNLGVAIGSDVQAWSTNLDDFSGKSAPSGDVVGTSDSQTLSNKTITNAISVSALGNITAASGQVLGGELAKSLATANRAAYFNSSGFLTEATTTTTELNYLSGVTSAVQTQIDGKGDASGPGSSTDKAIARFDGIGGKTLQNSLVTIDDLGGISATSSLSYLHSLEITTGNVTSATGNFEATAGNISCASGTLTTSALEMVGVTGNRAVYLGGTGLLTESSVTDTELGYLSGVTSSIQTQINNLPTATSTTTFSNKSFSDHLTLDEIAAPGTPSAGKVAIYPKTDGKLYIKDDTGTETDLTSAGGLTSRTGVVRQVFVAAGSMIGRLTNGAEVLKYETAGNIVYDGAAFDPATDEYLGFWVNFGKAWDAGTVKVKLGWTAVSGSGTVEFEVSARAYADSDVIDTAPGTAVAVTDTMLTHGDEHITPASSAITIAGTPAAGEPVFFQIMRDTSADTLAVDAVLKWALIEYTESSTEPTAW